MIDQQKLTVFKELFAQSESVLIIYAPDALRDHLFAATALYKTFQQIGNKQVSLLSSVNLFNEEQDIVFLDETKTDLGKKNLCISLDYLPDSVEKITSAIDEENSKLYLTIKPKKGIPPLSKENIEFSYTGADADMIILVGVDDLESLEQLYMGYENLYQTTALVSINSYETSFGNLKLDILGSSCVSEYIASFLKDLNLQIEHEVATNLLAGIDEETENLESYLATADTFEIVSFLLRSGARRFAREKNQDNQDQDSQQDTGEELSQNFNDSAEHEIFTEKQAENQFENSQNHNSQSNSNQSTMVISENIQDTLAASKPEQTQESSEPATSLSHSTSGVTQEHVSPKRGRGRPKGSKNRKIAKSLNASRNQDKQQEGTTSQVKPGSLKYNPTGFGPSST